MKNVNSVFKSIASSQGIEPGSTLWTNGGLAAYSGQTGAHPAYGWKHDHKLSEEWVRAVIANYGHRRCYYLDAPVRQVGYNIAGRPVGWVPEQGDLPTGEALYLTSKGIVAVSGPDILHFHIGPLISVYDSGDEYTVETGYGKQYASLIAGVIIRMLMKSMAGMLQKSPGKLNTTSTSWADRGFANILHCTTQAAVRNLIDAEDLKIIASYIEQVIIPFYGIAPGLALNHKPELINGLPNVQMYNGAYWGLPAMYWAWKVSPEGEFKDILYTIIKRLSGLIESMEMLVPGQGVRAHSITLNNPDVMIDSSTITKENIIIDPKGSNWEPWGFTAQCVAAEVLGSDTLKKSSALLADKYKNDYANKQWIVNENGDYL